MSQDPRYNWVYKELVTSQHDARGALAYVLYKQEKVAFIEDFVSRHQRPPNEADMAPFHAMTRLPHRLDAYRDQADNLLEEFLDNVLTNRLNDFTAKVRDDAIVKAVQTSWWRGVAENVVAGLVTTLITFFALLGMLVYTEGADKIFANALTKFNNETPASTTAPSTSPVAAPAPANSPK